MGRFDNGKLAQEAIEITKNGFYEKDDEKHYFSTELKYLDKVRVFSPEQVEDIKNDEDDFLNSLFTDILIASTEL